MHVCQMELGSLATATGHALALVGTIPADLILYPFIYASIGADLHAAVQRSTELTGL